MSRTPLLRPTRAAAVAGAMTVTLALAGCGAGQVAQTSSQVASVGGANVQAGGIAVRNAAIAFPAGGEAGVYPVGGTAPLRLTVVNESDVADRLVSLSSPVARTGRLDGDTALPVRAVLVAGGDNDGAAGLRNVREIEVALTGLREMVRPGPMYPVVLTFERAGDVRIDMPVAGPDSPRENPLQEGSPHDGSPDEGSPGEDEPAAG